MTDINSVESASKVETKPVSQDAAKVDSASTSSEADAKSANSTTPGLEIRKLVSASVLLDAGVQIGLSTKRWNPKMKSFIYKKHANNFNNNANYVIDLTKIVVFLDQAYKFLTHIVKNGGSVLFVCTKKNQIIRDMVRDEAKRVDSSYVNQRWLGGTITNFATISNSIKKLNKLVALQKFGEIDKYTKKEQVEKLREIEKLNKFVGGIRNMSTLPQAIVVIDPVADQNAVKEAKKKKIPVVALANTNADPTDIDFIVPCNNVSLRSLTLMVTILADAIAEAKNEPTKFVGKEDSEIVLPEVQKRTTNMNNMVVHKTYTKYTDKAKDGNKEVVKVEKTVVEDKATGSKEKEIVTVRTEEPKDTQKE